MKFCLIFVVFLSAMFAGCDSPTDTFERLNKNDPLSPAFSGGTVKDLQASAGSSSVIAIRWPESERIVTKNVLEKSLGDSLSFTPIAELKPDILQYSDSTREVRKDTFYRLLSYVELEGEEDVLYGKTQAKLEFGEISNETFEFLSESNRLQLSWRTDVPFYTHFIISSENVLTEDQENSVKIPAGKIDYEFKDPLLDIDFDTRKYTITGIIEYDGVEEQVVETSLTFDAKEFFKPENLEINILNEQDWEISWDEAPFFATEIELIRKTSHEFEDVIMNLPAESTTYLDSFIFDDAQNPIVNQSRKYLLRFLTENGKSESIDKFDDIHIRQPIIAFSNITQLDPNSLTIFGGVHRDDRDLIRKYIIEKQHSVIPDRYVEIARIEGGNNFEFTDTNVNSTMDPVYRVRTITSYPSEPATFTYSHDYNLDYSFNTGMDYVTSLEVSSGKKYLAAVSFRSGEGNSVLVTDIESQQTVSEISIPAEQISDIQISKNDEKIYFAVPTEMAIYKSDFPGGENIEKIIDDAYVNTTAVFNIDISADGSFLVGTGGRGFVKKWNLETYEAEFIFAEYSTPTFYTYKNIAISPGGDFILGNNGLPFILNAEIGTVVETLPWVSQNVTDHQFSKDGNYIAFVSGFHSTHIYSTESWKAIDFLNTGQRADFHPEKPVLVLSGRNIVYTYDVENSNIKDIISNQLNRDRPNHSKYNKIEFIDDKGVATITGGGTVQIWRKDGNQRRWKNANL